MSTYFGVDPLSTQTLDAFVSAWEVVRAEHPAARLYALVDAAFDEEGVRQFLERFEGPAVSLYAETRLSELDSVAPWLLELNTSDRKTESAQLRALAHLRGQRPMCTLLATARRMESLMRHFRSHLFVESDGMPLIFRFADTRVLETLTGVLSPSQMATLFPPDIHVWFPCRRDGRSAVRSMSDDGGAGQSQSPLLLDPQQFSALIEAGDADLVLHNLTEQDPYCFEGGRPSDIHAFVVVQLQSARAQGLHNMQDLEAYCLAAFASGPDFHAQPDVRFAISEAARVPGSLTISFADLPGAAWRQARERSPLEGGT